MDRSEWWAIPSINPATEEEICQIGVATADDVDSVVEAASEGARVWRDTPWADRAALMNKVADALLEVSEQLAQVDTAESDSRSPACEVMPRVPPRN